MPNSGVGCKVLELVANFWTLLQSFGIGCKVMELVAKFWTWLPNSGVGCKVLELVANFWTWLQSSGIGCKVMELVAKFWTWLQSSGAQTIKKNTNSTQNKSETHHAKHYEVTSFLSTDCELSTETCSKNVYSLGPWSWCKSSGVGCKVLKLVAKNNKNITFLSSLIDSASKCRSNLLLLGNNNHFGIINYQIIIGLT